MVRSWSFGTMMGNSWSVGVGGCFLLKVKEASS